MRTSEIIIAMNDVAAYLVTRYAREKGISRECALEAIMSTSVYEALLDPDTDMYSEPKAAVYDMLISEFDQHPEKMLIL